MIEIVTDRKLIIKYQRRFIEQLKTVCIEKIKCIVGYKGNSEEMTAFYSEKYNFWFTTGKSEHNNRYWNAFGLGRPEVARSNSITVEINQPFEGANRNIGGAFGHNNKGEVLILHRGKIGGGRKGIGKQLFFDNYRDKPIIADDDDGFENEFCLIGSIGSPYLPRQVANFVSEVHRIKNFKTDQTFDFSLLDNFAFIEEASGKRKVKRTGTIIIERTHGIVVNLLAKILEDKGHKIAKDKNRDLFVFKGKHITKLFEVKTSSSTQDLYAAVGQLLIYSIPIKTSVELIMVLPEKLSPPVEKRVNELGIQILYYQWNKDEPVFENIL